MRKLSIIITHYKTPRLLLKLLKSLSAISYQLSAISCEIIVVDSAAQKGLRIVMRKEFPEITYFPFSKNVGYAKLVNAGIKRVKGKNLLILNADIIIENEGIAKMLRFLESTQRAGAVGVTDCFTFPTLSAILARRTLWAKTPWGEKALRTYEMHDYERKRPHEVDWVRGDCWMIKKSAIKKVGLFDERFFLYFEDADWCRRAKGKGLGIYFLPGIKIVQQQLGASRQYTLKGIVWRFSHLISFIKYFLKWNGKGYHS